MPDPLDISWSTPADRDAILAFIAAMGFTPRDAATWDGLAMRAIVARRQDEQGAERIVGLLPIEPRPICVGGGRVVQAVHQTCVALTLDERGHGLGSLMQTRLDEWLPDEVELITVFREDPASPAYAWYRRNGFSPATHVIAYERSVAPSPSTLGDDWGGDRAAIESAETGRFIARNDPFLVARSHRPLADWLAIHPYRTRYAFEIVAGPNDSYAVVGVGKLHSAQPRLDILDLVAVDLRDVMALLARCDTLAVARGASPVRIAIASHDPIVSKLRELGFVPGWTFDLLIKPRRGRRFEIEPAALRYASIDFA